MVITPHMVSKAVSSCHMWCRGQCRHATCDVMGGVVGGVVAWPWWVSSCCMCRGGCCHVAVMMGVSHHVVSQSWLLHCIVVSWLQSLHYMWCRSHSHCAMWCCGHGGCCHTAWHCRIIIMVGDWAMVGPGGRGWLCLHWQR
jgi:hypothetical protein